MSLHRTVRKYINIEPEHPIYLRALLWGQGIERLGHHSGVGLKQRVPVPLKLLQCRLASTYSFQFTLRDATGFIELGKRFGQVVVAHVPLGREAQIAAPFLFDLREVLEPRVCLPVRVSTRPGTFGLYQFL